MSNPRTRWRAATSLLGGLTLLELLVALSITGILLSAAVPGWGRWMAERPGYRWVNDRWERGPNGWYHVAGRWDRADRNHNGIPDRYERNQAFGDRDHDGVPNIYDRRPDNPYRH